MTVPRTPFPLPVEVDERCGVLLGPPEPGHVGRLILARSTLFPDERPAEVPHATRDAALGKLAEIAHRVNHYAALVTALRAMLAGTEEHRPCAQPRTSTRCVTCEARGEAWRALREAEEGA